MKTEQLTVDEALRRGSALPFALVRSLSEVRLGPAPQAVNREELLEAYFFSDKEEIHIFRNDGLLFAVSLLAEKDDHSIEETYRLKKGQIKVRHTIETDEDGQSYIAATCLAGWEAK